MIRIVPQSANAAPIPSTQAGAGGEGVQVAEALRIPAEARLNRLPITSFYRRLTWLLGLVFFFDMGDINTFSFAAPAIMKSWHLSISRIAVLVSATFVGMFIGSTVGGWLSDRIGRKKALILTTVWYAGFSLLNAFVWEPVGLFATRMLTGVGISAMTVVGITYISEIYPAKVRGSYQGWIMAIGLVGVPVTAYVARFCVPLAPWGWRLVFVWGSLGIVLAFFCRGLVESPRWLENQGRTGEADAVVEGLEADARAAVGELPPIVDTVSRPPQQGRFSELIAPAHLPRTILLVFCWICFTLGFYGFTSWVPTLLVAHGFSLVHSLAWSSAMSLATAPGALVAALIADRWDRRWLIVAVALLIATCGLLYGLTFRLGMIIVFGFLVELLLHTMSPLLYTYTAESFPTEIRNSGMGLAYGTGRLANVFGPLLVAFIFNHYGYSNVFVYMALCWALLALMIGGLGARRGALV
jgi:MFS transporter, putative metabolite:H+ symporter